MKKIKQNKIVFTCILLISAMLCNAQEIDTIKHYKYGFINKIGKEITALKYDNANSFSEGIAKVGMKGKWGFVNAAGEEITALKYDTAYTCESGVARIKLDGKYGLIDKTGKEITPLKYDNISRFDHGVACVRINGKWGIINDKGIEITPLKYDYMQKANSYFVFSLKGKNKRTLIDEIGKPIESNPLGYFSDRHSYFDESGIAKVCLNGKWGFIDKTGKEITELKYDYVFFFSEGMARVLLGDKWGFINESGTEVIPLTYDFKDEDLFVSFCGTRTRGDYVKPVYRYKNGKRVKDYKLEILNEQDTYFNDGVVRVYRESLKRYMNIDGTYSRYFFLDKMGKIVTSEKYKSVSDSYYEYGRTKRKFYYEGLRIVKKEGGGEEGRKYGFADTLGKIVIPLKYDIVTNFKNGMAKIRLNGKHSLINKKGEQLLPLKYDYISEFDNGSARMSVRDSVSGKTLWGILVNVGNDVNPMPKEFTPLLYDFIDEFKEGLAKAESRKNIVFLKRNGDELPYTTYEGTATSFNEGFAEVVYKGKSGFIYKNGKAITPFKYNETKSFKNGLAQVRINHKWGFVNRMGEEITPLKYDLLEDFSDSRAIVKILAE